MCQCGKARGIGRPKWRTCFSTGAPNELLEPGANVLCVDIGVDRRHDGDQSELLNVSD